MQDEQLRWLDQWFQSSPEYVTAFSSAWEILWQNRTCPMLPPNANPCRILGFDGIAPQRGTHVFNYNGEPYSFRVDILDAAEEPIYLIIIAAEPYSCVLFENDECCKATMNLSAEIHYDSVVASHSLDVLQQLFDETSDQFPQLLDDAYKQINNIQRFCYKNLRTSLFYQEQVFYHNLDGSETYPMFLDRELANFTKCWERIFGRCLKITTKTGNKLCIKANRSRMEMALVCAVRQLYYAHDNINQMLVHAEQQGDSVILTISGHHEELYDRTPPSHHNPLFVSSLCSIEGTILNRFCEAYDVHKVFSNTDSRAAFTLRFPYCKNQKGLSLASPDFEISENEIFFYECLLSDMSGYLHR